MKQIKLILVTLVLLFLAGCQNDQDKHSITVVDAWARTAAMGSNGAVYMTIENNGDEDKLLRVTTDLAGSCELHESSMKPDGTMQMVPQEYILIPSNGSATLKPGGLHIMLIEVTRDMKEGDTLTLTLEFEKADQLTVAVPVQSNSMMP